MKKLCAFLAVLIFSSFIYAQEILTASAYFQTVSDFYATIKDYEASMDITIGKEVMTGNVSFKRPEMLRIDFSEPAEQVIVFNGDKLTIYLPGSSAILEQAVTNSSAGGASLATPQGLNLMNRYYTVAYETGQEAVPLEENSDEMVINLILNRRSAAESFREIKLSIDYRTNLIRRVVATTAQSDTFRFDFFDYKINTNINDQRFIYNPPSSANNYNNFLFSE